MPNVIPDDWDEDSPVLTQPRRDGALEIAVLREGVADRLAKEHVDPAGVGVGGEHLAVPGAFHGPGRDLLDDLLVGELRQLDAVLVQVAEQVLLHLAIPVGRDTGFEVALQLLRRMLPVAISRDRLVVRVQGIVDHLELDVLIGLVEHPCILVVVVERFRVVGRHDLDQGAHRVGELPPLAPTAVRHAVAVAVRLLGVGAVLVDLLEVREPIAIRVLVLSRRRRAAEAEAKRQAVLHEKHCRTLHLPRDAVACGGSAVLGVGAGAAATVL